MWSCRATDLDYVLLSPAAHSLRACCRADRINTKIFKRRQAAAIALERAGMQCERVLPPPEPGNLKCKRAWLRRHTPVSAEAQALAVEALALCDPPLLPDCGYAAEAAVSIANKHKLLLSVLGTRSPSTCNVVEGLIEIDDAKLLTMPAWKVRWVDLFNQWKFARQTRQRRQLRRRTTSMVRARNPADTAWTMISFMARRAELKERCVLVSAWEQAAAVVELLHHHKMRVHRDFAPQDAIALARERCVPRHTAQSPMTSFPTAPSLYPATAWSSA